MMPDREKVVKGLEGMIDYFFDIYRNDTDSYKCAKAQEYSDCAIDAIALLKEQEVVEPKIIPEELKQKMWNALYAQEDKFEGKYVGTIEHDSWFFIYRLWLQKGFNLAIKAIADWEGR